MKYSTVHPDNVTPDVPEPLAMEETLSPSKPSTSGMIFFCVCATCGMYGKKFEVQLTLQLILNICFNICIYTKLLRACVQHTP